MRRIGFLALSCALAGAGAGCRSAVEDFYVPLTSGSGTGGTGGSGGLPNDCQGDPTKDPSLVRDECGLFVSTAASGMGDGTKGAPFKTLGEAAKKSASRIFVCAGDYAETATVELSNGVEVYGGFGACPKAGDWTWDAQARANVTGPTDVPAAKVSMGKSLLQSVNLTAPNATAPGGSSIALLADKVDLTLTDVALKAGDGVNGGDGEVPSIDAEPGVDADADPNTQPTPACNAQQVGGKGTTNTCSDGDSIGGDGGKGGPVPANDGEAGVDGSPLPDPNPNNLGLGGQPTGISVTCNGAPGNDGDPGAAGPGGKTKGTLTTTGISGGEGADGMIGSRGGGGGGGAGAKAGMFCPPAGSPTVGPGASGGGGGSGGCGGRGGGGGKAGGSSIGVVGLSSTFTFAGVTITTGTGAAGGKGVAGKGGASGGKGAPGGAASGIGVSKPGCKGGDGGLGGPGGQGGGGRGGHSIGIAFLGDAPATQGVTFKTGAAGTGGTGDSANMGDGAMGTVGNTVDFK